MIDLGDLETVLNACPRRHFEAEKRASVAMIFHQDPEAGPEIFFIHRAEHPRDPWSGHMGFPGGRVDPEDASPLDAVYREVREEIGLDLEQEGRLLARLSDQRAVARGRPLGLVIEVRVFEVGHRPQMRANEEVQDMLWIPLAFFLDPENRGEMEYRQGDLELLLPCYHYGPKLIWGLSLRMLDEVLDCISGGL